MSKEVEGEETAKSFVDREEEEEEDEDGADYWAGGDEEGQGEDDEEEYEQDDSGLPRAARHVWLSDEERLRVAFRRARASAEKVDLDRSPFFPRTVAEYAGLKADMLVARAVRLRAKVRERERMLRARTTARWKRLFVVGRSGEIEEAMVPLYFGDREEREGAVPAMARPRLTAEDGKPASRQSRARTGQANAGCPRIPKNLSPEPTSTPGIFAYSAAPDVVARRGRDLAIGEAIHLQKVDEENPGRSSDAAYPAIRPKGTDSFSPGSLLPAGPIGVAAGHGRTSSATILREVAAHAAARRGNPEGSSVQIQADDGLTTQSSPFEDDVYDSDSSFTPTDYRPGLTHVTSVMSRAGMESPDEVGSSSGSSNGSTPTGYVTYLTALVETEVDMRSEIEPRSKTDEHHLGDVGSGQDEIREGPDGSSSPCFAPNNTLAHKLQAHKTPRGKMGSRQAGGMEGEPGHLDNGSVQTHNMRDHVKGTKNNNNNNNNNNTKTREQHALLGDDTYDTDDLVDTHRHEAAGLPVPAEHSRPAELFPPLPPPPPPPMVPQLATLALSARDGLTAVFARRGNPFSPAPPECDWPGVGELTAEGDGRVKRWDPTCYRRRRCCRRCCRRQRHHDHHDHHHLLSTTTTTTIPGQSDPGLGRFLPVPRLRDVVDPRLGPGAAATAAAALAAAARDTQTHPEHQAHQAYQAAAVLPWEVRAMARERRWDLHGERRIWEMWGWPFEEEEEEEEEEENGGWDRFGLVRAASDDDDDEGEDREEEVVNAGFAAGVAMAERLIQDDNDDTNDTAEQEDSY
ncbi:uncharacterized protein P884DRAFT_327877 [Thermothelomyces heterothallicus CBS 202.75]|uniref:uncharacterized protein n=1 Tax=Thermothelomyces heterothallicus CBS 202.75 TaxID=1149848 RepID=UPI00374419B3